MDRQVGTAQMHDWRREQTGGNKTDTPRLKLAVNKHYATWLICHAGSRQQATITICMK